MNRLLLFFLLLTGAAARAASGLSYLYIQGDKQTPFYVKVEDAMQPRFGKNYCIIPQLAAGATHIEILFQQNIFPAQKFTVIIPDGGSRGFLLIKRDAGFALYDLKTGAYIAPGDTSAADDGSPGEIPTTATSRPQNVDTAQVAAIEDAHPASASASPPAEIDTKNISPIVSSTVRANNHKPVTPPVPNEPQFINGIELSNNASLGTSAPAESKQDTMRIEGRPGSITVTNSDCPVPMRSEDFSTVFGGMAAFTTDEDRVDYLSDRLGKCYTSWMARTLAMRLESDAARFSLLKKIYPHITDQAAFPLLDDLLRGEAWKVAFAKLVHHQ